MLGNPSARARTLVENIQLFREFHSKYPSHGYRWLNAKIRLDKGLAMSGPYARKCRMMAGIKSESKHYRYRKPGGGEGYIRTFSSPDFRLTDLYSVSQVI